jgi:hypothetical protein
VDGAAVHPRGLTLLPKAASLTTGRLRKRALAALLEADADAVDERREQAQRQADVRCHPSPLEGMGTLSADLPAPVAAACHEVVDRLARMLEADGDTRPIGQLRAAVLADLVQRPWDTGRPPVTAHLQLVATLASLAGRTAQPGEVNGLPITTGQLRELLTELEALGLRTAEGGTVTLALIDDDGAVRATTPLDRLRRLARRSCPDHPDGTCGCSVLGRPAEVDRHDPSPGQQAFVHTRDRTCRFPTCGQRVGWADADHVVPPRPRRGHRLRQPLLPVPQPPPAQDLRPRLALHHERRRRAHRHHSVGDHPHHPATRHATTAGDRPAWCAGGAGRPTARRLAALLTQDASGADGPGSTSRAVRGHDCAARTSVARCGRVRPSTRTAQPVLDPVRRPTISW